jgi:predicted nucleic acid-binding protein
MSKPSTAARMVVDASVFLRSVFADEEGHAQALAVMKDHAFGLLELVAPTLLLYEVANGILLSLRGKRPARSLTKENAARILADFQRLRIRTEAVDPEKLIQVGLIQVGQVHQRTAYDAAYLALAEREGLPLITGDKRLYNAVKSRLDGVKWVGDYQSAAEVEEPE